MTGTVLQKTGMALVLCQQIRGGQVWWKHVIMTCGGVHDNYCHVVKLNDLYSPQTPMWHSPLISSQTETLLRCHLCAINLVGAHARTRWTSSALLLIGSRTLFLC